MTDKVKDLQCLITLSQAMLEKAREDSWDDVVNLEAERSGLIELFFLESVQEEYAEMVAGGIRAILAMDIDIMELGTLKKLDIVQILQKMEMGKKAVQAYGS
jgi:hypothetical protein